MILNSLTTGIDDAIFIILVSNVTTDLDIE